MPARTGGSPLRSSMAALASPSSVRLGAGGGGPMDAGSPMGDERMTLDWVRYAPFTSVYL